MISGADGHFRLEGPVDMSNADVILNQGARLFNRQQATVDLEGVTAVDSAAVSLLLEWRRVAAAAGHGIDFVNLPTALLSLAELYGVSDLIESGSASKD